jgi:hypothetical protein
MNFEKGQKREKERERGVERVLNWLTAAVVVW